MKSYRYHDLILGAYVCVLLVDSALFYTVAFAGSLTPAELSK